MIYTLLNADGSAALRVDGVHLFRLSTRTSKVTDNPRHYEVDVYLTKNPVCQFVVHIQGYSQVPSEIQVFHVISQPNTKLLGDELNKFDHQLLVNSGHKYDDVLKTEWNSLCFVILHRLMCFEDNLLVGQGTIELRLQVPMFALGIIQARASQVGWDIDKYAVAILLQGLEIDEQNRATQNTLETEVS